MLKKVKGAKSLTVRPDNKSLQIFLSVSSIHVDSQQEHVLGCDKLGQGQLAHLLQQRLAKVFLSYISIWPSPSVGR